MTSYWAAYHGDGLVLNESEFDAFCRNYARVKGLNEDDLFGDELIREYGFEKSDNPKETFEITDILVDECDGMYFRPFMDGNEPNIYKLNPDKTLARSVKAFVLRDKNCYVAFSDYDRTSVNAFENPPYKTYEEFKQEFIGKFKAYLPEDFDWDAHLGSFSYACYA